MGLIIFGGVFVALGINLFLSNRRSAQKRMRQIRPVGMVRNDSSTDAIYFGSSALNDDPMRTYNDGHHHHHHLSDGRLDTTCDTTDQSSNDPGSSDAGCSGDSGGGFDSGSSDSGGGGDSSPSTD